MHSRSVKVSWSDGLETLTQEVVKTGKYESSFDGTVANGVSSEVTNCLFDSSGGQKLLYILSDQDISVDDGGASITIKANVPFVWHEFCGFILPFVQGSSVNVLNVSNASGVTSNVLIRSLFN